MRRKCLPQSSNEIFALTSQALSLFIDYVKCKKLKSTQKGPMSAPYCNRRNEENVLISNKLTY